MIGYTYMDERKVLEIKMKNQKKIKDSTFDQLFYHSIGIEHFAIALSKTDRVRHIDLSENDIGKENFLLLLSIFKSNPNIQTINVADCNIDGNCVSQMCKILKATNTQL
jgi:Ran GTPase-activating protein (RanGAP) involved in mRNA processing and transport